MAIDCVEGGNRILACCKASLISFLKRLSILVGIRYIGWLGFGFG